MPTKYRLIDEIDWEALHEQKVQIEVSASYIILKPMKPGASLVILAQAVKSRPAKSNGQPAVVVAPDATDLAPVTERE